jgi:hypothetical protein
MTRARRTGPLPRKRRAKRDKFDRPFRYPPHLQVTAMHNWGDPLLVVECLVCLRSTGHKTQARPALAKFLKAHRRCGAIALQ